MKRTAFLCIASLVLAGCQTEPTTPAPSGLVAAPAESSQLKMGAGDSLGWALFRAEKENLPPGQPVGEYVAPR